MIILQPEFVEYIPSELEEGILYISMKYKAVGHKCPCGCGNLVFTPLCPPFWQLYYDGKGVSLFPSIGNGSFDCKSHYWIINNEIHFARKWNDKEVKIGRKKDSIDIQRYMKKLRRR